MTLSKLMLIGKIYFKKYKPYVQYLVFFEFLATISREYLSKYYQFLQWRQWHKGSPEWFDHRIDLFNWHIHRNPHWLERGIYSKEYMTKGCKVLDIASGDGFYPYYFYVSTGATIDAIDINPKAIAHSQKYHSHKNIHYYQQDAVSKPFPRTSYDVICFDGAIDHFTHEKLKVLMPKIKKALEPKGVFSIYQELGYTKPDDEHPIYFMETKDLKVLLNKYFKYIDIIVTETPGRKNAYIRCTNFKETLKKD